MSEAEDRRRRAAERAGRMVVRVGDAADGEHDLSPVSGAAAVALAVELSRIAWVASGRELPDIPRSELPLRWIAR